VPTWRGLIQQRTRWSEGSLRCLFDHAAALVRAPVPWRKRLDFLVFLSSSLVMALSMIASYGYLAEQWISDATSRGLSVADALPVRGHQPMYTYYWIVVMLATVVAIAIERKPGALMLAWSSGRYIVFAMHQIVTLPLALYRYSRSVFTGRFEWMKTEHHGVGLPDLSGLLAGRPANSADVAGPVLARVGFSGGADPTIDAVPPPP